MDEEAIDARIKEEQVDEQQHKIKKKKKQIKLFLLLLNCALVCLGQVGGPLLIRLYYLHGGKRIWLTSWIQTAAFPLLLIPPLLSRARDRARAQSRVLSQSISPKDTKVLLNPKLLIASIVMGLIVGVDSYMFGLGLSYLPVSTSSLLMSTQLAFTAVFSLLLVRQKFTSYSINAVVLMTLGSVILAFHTNGDRPVGVSKGEYFVGFFMTLGAAALLGFMLPLIELSYSKACKVITYDLVLQVQFVVSMVATIFCTVAMVINKDFQAMTREAQEYGLGEGKYYMVITLAALAMQCMLAGNLGVVFCSTALFGGVLLALLLPIQQIFAVIFFHEKFNPEKGISLALSLWGFVSYFYGEHKLIKKQKQASLLTQQLHSTTGH
ncbi:hypothetical protein AQUCO_01000092v1 [Aquilegia coerulea]|uniref:Probable purine permease n=1 Tax=Aquilegia coerulea TaxID=218851 RepID=A0A2G5E878_AQUCA|nr:hypothetical protein AQUCO_01000092v1 [Aquilegia coerulea]